MPPLFQDWNTLASGCVVNNVPTLSCIPAVFKNVINATLVFAGVVALFFIIFSGIKFINSGGDAKQVEGARKTLTWAIIGLVVILFSFFIVNFLSYITGVSCLNSFGFSNCQ